MNETKMDNAQPAKAAGTLIYVVDDEPMLLELAAVILEPLGYTINAFVDPKDALGSFASTLRRPDLLITDYAMHSMTGMQLIADLRRLEPRQKILLVSGTVGEDVFEDVPSKPDRFLAKPYEAREFVQVVDSLLAKL